MLACNTSRICRDDASGENVIDLSRDRISCALARDDDDGVLALDDNSNDADGDGGCCGGTTNDGARNG